MPHNFLFLYSHDGSLVSSCTFKTISSWHFESISGTHVQFKILKTDHFNSTTLKQVRSYSFLQLTPALMPCIEHNVEPLSNPYNLKSYVLVNLPKEDANKPVKLSLQVRPFFGGAIVRRPLKMSTTFRPRP